MGKTKAGRPGPDEAFRRPYAEHFGAILRFALRRVRSPDDAADVVADTFLVAWRRSGEMPDGEAARLWLFPPALKGREVPPGVARNLRGAGPAHSRAGPLAEPVL